MWRDDKKDTEIDHDVEVVGEALCSHCSGVHSLLLCAFILSNGTLLEIQPYTKTDR